MVLVGGHRGFLRVVAIERRVTGEVQGGEAHEVYHRYLHSFSHSKPLVLTCMHHNAYYCAYVDARKQWLRIYPFAHNYFNDAYSIDQS